MLRLGVRSRLIGRAPEGPRAPGVIRTGQTLVGVRKQGTRSPILAESTSEFHPNRSSERSACSSMRVSG